MGDRLTPRQMRAVEALLSGASQTEAARIVGVSRRTVYAWSQGEQFREVLRSATRDAMADATRQLTAATGPAIATLRDMVDEGHSAALRLRAAHEILSAWPALAKVYDLAEQISEIDRTLKEAIADGKISRKPSR